MNKIEIVKSPIEKEEILFRDMPLGSIGRIVNDATYRDVIVRRTCSEDHFLVESLSNPGEDNCWSCPDVELRVVLLPNAKIIVQL